MTVAAAATLIALAIALPQSPQEGAPPPVKVQPTPPSRAYGHPWDGRLVSAVQLPAEGPGHVTWDPALRRVPSRDWRLWGTDRLLDAIESVLARYRATHPDAPRVVIGDLSRPHGGDFGERFGGLGHRSHQNGLDVDVYYPRRDRRERAPRRVAQVDLRLAQELVDLFVAAGAEKVFVGPRTRLHGAPDVVQELPHHNNHLHVRIR